MSQKSPGMCIFWAAVPHTNAPARKRSFAVPLVQNILSHPSYRHQIPCDVCLRVVKPKHLLSAGYTSLGCEPDKIFQAPLEA